MFQTLATHSPEFSHQDAQIGRTRFGVRSRVVGVASILALASLALSGLASEQSQQSGNIVSSARAQGAYEAIARASDDLALAFTIPGRLEEVLAQPGTQVKAGQPMLRLAAPEAKAEVELLRLRAGSTLEEEAAKAEWDLAALEEERWGQVHERGASTDMQLRKARLETQRARLAYELFVQRRNEASLQLQQAQARLAQSTLLAPIDGQIDEVVVESGEVVEPGTPVIRLVSTQRLRIDVQVPTGATLDLQAGDKAWMETSLTSPPTKAMGRILHIASVADSSSDTRLVRVEVDAPPGLPAGINCVVGFGERP